MIVFIVIAVVMGVYAIMLLTFGFLATGATRQNIYSGVKCIMGGRVSAAFVSTSIKRCRCRIQRDLSFFHSISCHHVPWIVYNG